MSYDFHIRSDDRYSKRVSRAELAAWINSLRQVKNLRFGDGRRRWMELDLELMDRRGEPVARSSTSPEINCVSAHIPLAFAGAYPPPRYLELLREIVGHLGWEVVDRQTGELLGGPEPEPASVYIEAIRAMEARAYPRARKLLDRALREGADAQEVCAMRAECLLELGELAGARKDIDRALADPAGVPQFRSQLAKLERRIRAAESGPRRR